MKPHIFMTNGDWCLRIKVWGEPRLFRVAHWGGVDAMAFFKGVMATEGANQP